MKLYFSELGRSGYQGKGMGGREGRGGGYSDRQKMGECSRGDVQTVQTSRYLLFPLVRIQGHHSSAWLSSKKNAFAYLKFISKF